MESVIYWVHSDVDEANAIKAFDNEEDAIAYAEEMGDCWVDRVL